MARTSELDSVEQIDHVRLLLPVDDFHFVLQPIVGVEEGPQAVLLLGPNWSAAPFDRDFSIFSSSPCSVLSSNLPPSLVDLVDWIGQMDW